MESGVLHNHIMYKLFWNWVVSISTYIGLDRHAWKLQLDWCIEAYSCVVVLVLSQLNKVILKQNPRASQ